MLRLLAHSCLILCDPVNFCPSGSSLHELEVIKRFTDRVICIKDGKVDKEGTPEEIIEDKYIEYLFDMA